MYKLYKKEPAGKKLNVIQIVLPAILPMLFALAFDARAQEGSQGNTTIFAGVEMGFFGDHNFATGGGPVMPGIVNTERATSPIGTGYGWLSYANAATQAIGANDLNHVDGYVRKYSSTAVKFTFPVGDNNVYRPFAASPADQVTGAYYRADPTLAITSNRAGGSYGPLPEGKTFPTTSMGPSLTAVFNKGYWDIDGAAPSQLSLSWDNVVNDDIATFTGGNLGKLVIVGWNPAGAGRWEIIPSVVDAPMSLFGVPSSPAQGSITSDFIVPTSYTVYTLGIGTPDLTPNITINPSNISGVKILIASVDVYELNDIATTGAPITLSIKTDPAWVIGITPGTVIGDWTYTGVAGLFHRFTSNVILKYSSSSFNFPLTFNPNGKTGNFIFGVTISSSSGGENPNTNNSDQETILYKP